MVEFLEVNSGNQNAYCQTGRLAYRQHYTHLWIDEDPSPYISESFTPQVVARELKDPLLELFIILLDKKAVGIMKFIKDCEFGSHSSEAALHLEKLYLLKAACGQGIGSRAINFTENYARKLGKEIIWLDTMQEGPALGFYLKNGFSIQGEKMLPYSGVHESKKPMFFLAKQIWHA